jgi:hypothetical protein
LALLIDGMNFVSRKGEPLPWTGFPACSRSVSLRRSNWRRKGAKNQSLALVKNLNSSRIYATPIS